ncbi:MAG: murein biosynthesis integral membrane protein MurJ [Deltaproteobacteria bacterium]|nr:murein biosynthesis integral membrane protein MurJ [Deltaproteobacteria bacterium]
MSEHHRIARRTGTVSFLTLISRIFGLFRDMAIAHTFGTKLAADAFFVAFRIPNLFRRLFAEGALTVSFVPVFTESLKKSKEEAKETVNTLFTLTLVVLSIVSLLGVIFSPWIVKLVAWGFSNDPVKFSLTVYLNRIMFPYLLMISLAAVGMGILNSLKHFAAPAAGPILMNIGIIVGALFFVNWFHPPVVGLAVGVLVGGVLQTAIQIPALRRYGFLPRWNWNLRHSSVNKMGRLMLPSAYGAAAYQFNVVIITLIASFLTTGSVSYLWYADRVMEFPVGVFAIAMATVILPTLSEYAAEKNMVQLKATFNYGLRVVFFITIPATFGLIVLAGPIVHVLFEHGNFTSASAEMTRTALQFFALGLPFISGVRMTSNAFYSLQDAKTPVRIANFSVVVNIVLSLLLIKPMAHNGLALAVSLAAVFNFVMHILDFRKKVGMIGLRSIIDSVVKQLLASLGMSFVILFLLHFLPGNLQTLSLFKSILALSGVMISGMVIYFLLSWILKVREFSELLHLFLTRGSSLSN